MAQSISSKKSHVSQSISEVKVTENDFNSWVKNLYSFEIKDDELSTIYESVKYQGFDRIETLKFIMKLPLSMKLIIELIILCALRGPVQASRTTLSNGMTPLSIGIGSGGGKGKRGLTCGKITAATADLAAYYLKRLNVTKKITTIDLPGWLQFPSAGAIRMPDALRSQHVMFSKEFSKRIGGTFNDQIYETMIHNSYLNEALDLFK
jgi:hypothetical protein